MAAFFWPPVVYPQAPWVGMFLTKTAEFGWHLGIVFRGNQDATHALHLIGHRQMVSEKPKDGWWCVQLNVDPALIPAVTAFLRRIQKNRLDRRIPYGFTEIDREWFSPTGGFLEGAHGEGLNCSTFVLAVLRSAGIDLLDQDTWLPRPGDDRAKNEWVARLGNFREFLEPDVLAHFDAMVRLPGLVRFRIMEIFGAGFLDEYPVSFKLAIRNGDDLRGGVCVRFREAPPEI